jgi:hypothetical protein
VQKKIVALLAKQEQEIKEHEQRIAEKRREEDATIAEMTGLHRSKD